MKLNNMLLLFVILLVGVLSLSMVSANDVNDVAVSNDDGNFTELQNIVKDGGIVMLDKNYKAVENETAITISKNTLINGYNHIIDANGYCGIFNVNDGVTLTLKNLNLQNAYSFSNGGAINTNNGNIILKEDVTFINNNAVNGGAIYSESSISIDCENIKFINNTAYNGWGGAIHSQHGNVNIIATNLYFYNNKALYNGGAIYTNESSLNIKSEYTLFKKNSAGWSGGAIYARNNISMDVKYLTFVSNVVLDGYGGAISIFNSSGILITASDIQFNNNKASEDGGAICAGYATLKVKSTLIFNNNSAFGDEYGGGALNIHHGNLNINAFELNFINNHARNNGGAILYEGCGNLTINADLINFVNNSAKNGGAIYSNGATNIQFTTFENNTAREYGGAIYSNWTNIVIKDSYFINNKAVYGGAIHALSSKITLKHVEFSRNSARNGAGILSLNSTINVNYIFFNNNRASKVGGAIALLDQSKGYITESEFLNNYAMDGSAIMESGNTFCDVANSIFNNNIAEDTGSISIEYSSILNINDSTFEYNKAINGAAISIEYNSNATLKSILCDFNNATTGGAIDIYGKCNVVVSDSKFINNKANSGGAICLNSESNLEISDCKLNSNKATSGGAIDVLANSTINIQISDFNKNYAQNGAAIEIDDYSDVFMQACYFNSNIGNDGGAIKISRYSKLELIDSEFINNDGTSGGAIKASKNSIVLLNRVLFAENDGDDGGAIYCSENASLFIYNSQFDRNEAFYGGAISNHANLFVTNSSFNYNNAYWGGAIDGFGGFSIIEYCEFAYNDIDIDFGKGTSIYVDKGVVFIKFNNFKANDSDDTIHVGDEGVISLSNNTIEGFILNEGFIDSETNLKVLNNDTVAPGESVVLKALFTDDNGNKIYGLREIIFNVNGTLIWGNYDNPAVFKTNETGHYDVSVIYEYSNKTKQTIIPGYINVEESYKLTVNDVLKYYGGYETLIISLTNAGAPVVGEKVTISLNGQTYTKITDQDGEINLSINLGVGNYTAIVKYGDLTEEASVVVLSTIYGEDIVKTYQNDTQYYAYFTDSKGNALVNSYVNFNINGVFYTRFTDDKGVARLNINLIPGDYILTAYNPETSQSFSNNIKVLPILVGNDLIKNTNEKAAYEVTAYDSQGNLLAGADITININGVMYHRTTDSNGIARLNINLNPGEYIATAYFNGFATSNKITVF